MIQHVFAYARARLKAAQLVEHTGGFTYTNIPATALDRHFHLELGQVASRSLAQDNLTVEVPFTVRIFVAPARDTAPLIDKAIARADAIITDFVAAANRLTATGLKNIVFNNMTIEPIADSNDNGVMVQLNFQALVVYSTR